MAGQDVGGIVVSDHARAHIGDTIHHHYHATTEPQDDVYSNLFRSLAFPGMDARARNIGAALATTCEWLYHHQTFATWTKDDTLHEHHGLLWIKGKPGSGKSTLMKETLAWTEQVWPGRLILSYFFNARSPHQFEKSSIGLFRCLLHQLLCLLPNGRFLFTKVFAPKMKAQEVEEWTVTEIQNFLIRLIKSVQIPPIFLFVDALDEGIDDDVRDMVTFLESWSEHAIAVDFPLRVCLSSRHYPHIGVSKGLSLIVEDQVGHDQDIELYVRRKLFGGDSLEMTELQRKVKARSAGVFLWVVLVIPVLNKAHDQGRSMASVARKLDETPSNLLDLFDQILVNNDGLEECLTLLRWVLYAKRPLSPIELYCAVQHACYPLSADDFDILSTEEMTRYFLNCSRGLVELTKDNDSSVQFIHESIREYLTSDAKSHTSGPRSPPLNSFMQYFRADICHEKLAEACLRNLLLCFRKLSSEEPVQCCYYFIFYAANSWWQHLESSRNPYSNEIMTLALDLLTGSTNSLLFWVNACELEFDDGVNKANLAPALYWTACVGRYEIASELLASGVDVNARGGYHNTALHAASIYGHEEVVRVLIDAGADVNDAGVSHGSALYTASSYGHERIVQLLINAGANINDTEPSGTALHAATIHNYERVVQILVSAGANINASGGYHGTALHTASTYGFEKIVQILIDAGANVNDTRGYRGTALYTASIYGHEKVVRLLVNAGAVTNDTGGHYGTALYAALVYNYEKVLQVLVEAGSDLDARINLEDVGVDDYGTVLHAASIRGYVEVVQILVRAKADVNAQTEQFHDTVLQSACITGHEKVVQILIDAGADVNVKGGSHGTALQTAHKFHHEKIVQILLNSGAQHLHID